MSAKIKIGDRGRPTHDRDGHGWGHPGESTTTLLGRVGRTATPPNARRPWGPERENYGRVVTVGTPAHDDARPRLAGVPAGAVAAVRYVYGLTTRGAVFVSVFYLAITTILAFAFANVFLV